MVYRLGSRSLSKLEGVHPDLVMVVKRAILITEVDFTVLEGLRSLERQKKLVASGASQTLNSRHLTGHAVDLGAWVDSRVAWDWPLYYKIADAMKKAARDLSVGMDWGGDWQEFKDGPHYQLKWNYLPEPLKVRKPSRKTLLQLAI
jgi:peptidoglycan L-alanyl-D-glutamate endopeptidase CwlK